MVKNKYQKFTKRLTRWMKKEKLVSYVVPFHAYHGNCYGRQYIIKSNRKKIRPKYAVFIEEQNQLRRAEDILFRSGIKFIDLIMMNRYKKEEGISLLKTLERGL